MAHLVHTIASELNVRVQQVEATLKLIDEGATVPFIARYRKEITGGLDDTQLRELAQRATYLTELNSRRNTILESIEQQGKLTEALRQQINTAVSKTTLEDLYLPYKPKRRTKGQIAKEAGLAPLAESLFTTPTLDPAIEATAYYNHEAGFADTKAVLDGARAILMEQFAEDAQLLAKLRTYLRHHAHLTSKLVPGMEQAGEKFQDYFNHNEPLSKVPSHRALAMLRGRNEGFLHLSLNADPDQDESLRTSYCTQLIAEHLHFQEQGRAADSWLLGVINWTWRVKLSMSLETELIGQLREQSEQAAIQVFSQNLSDLLMAPPAGMRPTLGLDPGLRTGVKVAVVDQTGKLVDTETIYPHVPRKQWDAALHTLQKLVKKHQIELIAVGNGTASRETDKLAAELISQVKPHHLTKVMVSEAGASVYSASALAAREFPELDVSLRGAASIARRLQDPLAELVKIEPKAIGVGQYQHDVSQSQLARSLNDVVERCVNQVGVNLNTASAPLLEHVAGLTPTLAQNIILMRENLGQFSERKQLLKVPRLGPKAFEQCAGFLRINDGKQPLDASSVHPEAYPLVTKISRQANTQIDQLIGNRQLLSQFSAHTFVDSQFGLPTIMDVLSELEKPGQDPRGEFTNAEFTEGVETIQDLQLAMVLEGVVTNVTHFGAFVDVGVHQDGLVHISALSHKFIEDPRQIVKAGDLVKVKVMSVDAKRKRIALSMRLDDEPQSMIEAETATQPRTSKPRPNKAPTPNVGGSAMGDAFAQAQQRRRR